MSGAKVANHAPPVDLETDLMSTSALRWDLLSSHVEDRELRSFSRLIGGEQRKLPGQVVKRRPKVMRNLTNADAPIESEHWSVLRVNTVDMVSRLGIKLCLHDLVVRPAAEGFLRAPKEDRAIAGDWS